MLEKKVSRVVHHISNLNKSTRDEAIPMELKMKTSIFRKVGRIFTPGFIVIILFNIFMIYWTEQASNSDYTVKPPKDYDVEANKDLIDASNAYRKQRHEVGIGLLQSFQLGVNSFYFLAILVRLLGRLIEKIFKIKPKGKIVTKDTEEMSEYG